MEQRHSGFTLVELLVGLLIGAILMTMAVPAFRDLMENTRLTSTSNELVAALNVARSEAVKRGTPVSVCRSTNGANCAAGTDWEEGWIVFTDDGVAGTVDNAGTQPDQILRAHDAVDGNVVITANGFNTSGYARFQSDGQEMETDDGFFNICDDRANEVMRQLELSATGRVQLVAAPPACP